ncbi:uncharacterized protein LOC131163503 [Malania oleifera]|uniref:uncharacterized protein LOC131163503 n=1 Tax=Malania oleifera TaxID=397392 RepID=UPI0025ADFC91|nr:uncharacterized protein LOC131163503 [Malania oleifera]
MELVQCIGGYIWKPWYSILINGTAMGFFKEEKGLRHGDPLSPYLFVMVIEVFSRILRDAIANHFLFFANCEKIQLVDLCFAGDLLILTKGDHFSVRCVKRLLDIFYRMSGLHCNEAIYVVFFLGVDHAEMEKMSALLSIKKGVLPVHYLGLPLITKKVE